MVRIVEEKCSFDKGKGIIVLETDETDVHKAHDILLSINSKNLALEYAASKGLVPPRINGSIYGPYPVNKEGLDLAEAFEKYGTDLHSKFKVEKFRVSVPVCQGIIMM